MAVCDPEGRVHGIANLYVADASVLPDLPRANTNLTVAAVADRIAENVSEIV
jgi:choline dehydrogenase-like flavoprotein